MDPSFRKVVHGIILVLMLFPFTLLMRGLFRQSLSREEMYRLLLLMACLTIMNMAIE